MGLPLWHQFSWLWGGEGQGGASGVGYLITSGPLGDLFIIGGVVAIVRRHNCHTRGCWRIGKHAVEGTSYVVCARHHPHVPDRGATAEQIAVAHAAAVEGATRVREGA